jgi:hypothetical protein
MPLAKGKKTSAPMPPEMVALIKKYQPAIDWDRKYIELKEQLWQHEKAKDVTLNRQLHDECSMLIRKELNKTFPEITGFYLSVTKSHKHPDAPFYVTIKGIIINNCPDCYYVSPIHKGFSRSVWNTRNTNPNDSVAAKLHVNLVSEELRDIIKKLGFRGVVKWAYC